MGKILENCNVKQVDRESVKRDFFRDIAICWNYICYISEKRNTILSHFLQIP